MIISEFESKLNQWGHAQVPFLFLVDFELVNLLAWPIHEVPEDILFSIYDFSNSARTTPSPLERVGVRLTKHPILFSDYKARFELVKERISLGDSYLANLTIKTKIDIDMSICKEIASGPFVRVGRAATTAACDSRCRCRNCITIQPLVRVALAAVAGSDSCPSDN